MVAVLQDRTLWLQAASHVSPTHAHAYHTGKQYTPYNTYGGCTQPPQPALDYNQQTATIPIVLCVDIPAKWRVHTICCRWKATTTQTPQQAAAGLTAGSTRVDLWRHERFMLHTLHCGHRRSLGPCASSVPTQAPTTKPAPNPNLETSWRVQCLPYNQVGTWRPPCFAKHSTCRLHRCEIHVRQHGAESSDSPRKIRCGVKCTHQAWIVCTRTDQRLAAADAPVCNKAWLCEGPAHSPGKQ